MSEMQAQFFFLLTTGKIPVPATDEHYHLLHAKEGRIQYGVDFSSYMSQLARDMGSAPSLWSLVTQHGWFVTFVYWYVSQPRCRQMSGRCTVCGCHGPLQPRARAGTPLCFDGQVTNWSAALARHSRPSTVLWALIARLQHPVSCAPSCTTRSGAAGWWATCSWVLSPW